MPAPKDITRGTKFGKLTFVKWICGTTPRRAIFKCDCGVTKDIIASNVRRGITVSCGCISKKSKVNVGDVFGRWIVREVGRQKCYGGKTLSACLCECSCDLHTKSIVTENSLVRGKSMSCGCVKYEPRSNVKAKHEKRMCYGYAYVYHPEHQSSLKKGGNKGFVMEHRYVMEKHLGRILNDNECVHHKDHNRLNNALENLELMTISEHSKLHAKEKRIGHEHYCITCGVEIPCTRVKKCKTCIEQEKNISRNRFGDDEHFSKLLETMSFEKIGRLYGVSGNAVKKAAIRRGIKFTPHTKNFIAP